MEGATLRRQGRGGRGVPRVRRADDVPAHHLLLRGLRRRHGSGAHDDGTLVLTMPMADQPLAGIAVADIGRTALGAFKRGAELIGETVSIAGDHLTGDQYASAFSDAFGEDVVYRPKSWDDFRGRGSPAPSRWATYSSTTRRTRRASWALETLPPYASSIRHCSRFATGLPALPPKYPEPLHVHDASAAKRVARPVTTTHQNQT